MEATIEIEKKDSNAYSVRVGSECEMVIKLGKEVSELTMMDAFKRVFDNPVYVGAVKCLRHVACPVPSAILKALEVEAGLNVPKDVSITFVKEQGEDGDAK